MISAGEAAQKIGMTNVRPASRLAALQTAHHTRLALLGYVEVAPVEARAVEQAAHAFLQGKRAQGEWFQVPASVAIEAVERASGVPCIIVPDVDEPALTGRQMRAARALLGWSAQELADHSKVGVTTIRRTEVVHGPVRMIAGNVDAILRAFDAVGIEFIDPNGGGDGVRMRHPQDDA